MTDTYRRQQRARAFSSPRSQLHHQARTSLYRKGKDLSQMIVNVRSLPFASQRFLQSRMIRLMLIPASTAKSENFASGLAFDPIPFGA